MTVLNFCHDCVPQEPPDVEQVLLTVTAVEFQSLEAVQRGSELAQTRSSEAFPGEVNEFQAEAFQLRPRGGARRRLESRGTVRADSAATQTMLHR
jgi:hypothetical protein